MKSCIYCVNPVRAEDSFVCKNHVLNWEAQAKSKHSIAYMQSKLKQWAVEKRQENKNIPLDF